MKGWMVVGFVLMAVYLFALGGGVAWVLVKADQEDDRLAVLAAQNRRNAQILTARECVEDHRDYLEIQAAVSITPTAILEVTASSPDSDPAQIQAFLDSIERQVAESLTAPVCDVEAAEQQLERLGVGP